MGEGGEELQIAPKRLLTNLDYCFQVGLKYNESIVIRVTGCPNGCARPYMAELGLVGDGPNSYQVLYSVETLY